MSPYKFQAERQAILDYLHAHPGSISMDLVRGLRVHKNTLKTRILRMEELGEITRKPTVYHSIAASGKIVAQRAYQLFAAVKTAGFVDQMRPMIELQAARALAKPDRPKAMKRIEPTPDTRVQWRGGSCKNTSQDRPPLRNQGGQGAVRRDVTVQSSAEMI